MPQLPNDLATYAAPGKLTLLTIAGAIAAAWFWSRQNEEPLQRRTVGRLRPRVGKAEE